MMDNEFITGRSKRVEQLMDNYLEGNLNDTDRATLEQHISKKPLVKQELARFVHEQELWKADQKQLMRIRKTTPSDSQLLGMMQNWKTRKSNHGELERLVHQPPSLSHQNWPKWVGKGLLIGVIWASLTYFAGQNFLTNIYTFYDEYAVPVTLVLGLIGVWSIEVISRLLVMFRRREVGTNLPVMLILTLAELLALTGVLVTQAGSLIAYLDRVVLSKDARLLISAVGLAVAFYLCWKIYQMSFVGRNRELQRKTGYKMKVLLSTVTLLLLFLAMPFIVETLSMDGNNLQVFNERVSVAIASEPEAAMPPSAKPMIGQVSFLLNSSTRRDPTVPATSSVYRQVVQPWGKEDAQIFAASYGFNSSSIKEDEVTNAYIFTTPQKNKLVLSRQAKGVWSYTNYTESALLYPGAFNFPTQQIGQQIERGQALSIAQEFLGKTPLFSLKLRPITGQLVRVMGHVESISDDPRFKSGIHYIYFGQEIDNHFVGGATAVVIVGGNGQVLEAASRLLPLTRVETYQLNSPEDIAKKLGNKELPYYQIYQSANGSNIEGSGGTNPILPQYGGGTVSKGLDNSLQDVGLSTNYRVGDTVEVNGTLDAVLYRDSVGKEPDRLVLSLRAGAGNVYYTFYLHGTGLRELARLDQYQVTLKGKLTKELSEVSNEPQPAPGAKVRHYQMEVTSFKKDPVEQRSFKFVGREVVEELGGKKYLLLVDDDGSRYASLDAGHPLTNPSYAENVQARKGQLAYSEANNQHNRMAAIIQETGERVEGIPLVKIGYRTIGSGVTRNEAKITPRPRVVGYPPTPAYSIPDGSQVQIGEIFLGYYAQEVQPEGLASRAIRPEELLAQPVYNLKTVWSNPSNNMNGKLYLTVPATKLVAEK